MLNRCKSKVSRRIKRQASLSFVSSSNNQCLLCPRLDYFASIAPVAASPLLGFVDVPAWPVSIIDFHGLRDTVRILTYPSS